MSIVTIINNISPSNWDNMSTLKKMSNFLRQKFQNVQLITFNFGNDHSSLALLLLLELLACLVSLSLVGDIVIRLFGIFYSLACFFRPLRVPSINIEVSVMSIFTL
jgi:hypothetical protein